MKDKQPDSKKAAKTAPEQHVKRLETLRGKRSLVETSWRKAYEHTYPLRGERIGNDALGGAESLAAASAKNARIYDGTLKRSTRMLASALFSGLTPANSRWFSQSVINVNDAESKTWLDESSNTIWLNIHNCNFDQTGYESFIDYVIAGMFPMYIEPGDLQNGKLYNFSLWPLAGCFFADSTGKGMIDTVYRVLQLTAEQAVSEYGDAVSDEVKKYSTEKPDEPVQVLWAIYPRKGWTPENKTELPIASDHVEIKTKRSLRESGYHEMPVVAPRWMPIPDSVYSLGIVDDAMPDHLTLNELVKYVLANADLAIAGMWGATDDGVLNPKTVTVGPRKIIPMANKDSLFPLQPSGKFDVAALEKAELQGSIKQTLLSDQLHPEQGPQMTATEIHMRAQLVRQLLGPMYGRLQSEYMVPVVNRCFGIALRAGVLGDLDSIPEAIRGRTSNISFQSPLARAQKLDDVAAMERFEGALIGQATNGMPGPMDNYDWDGASREKANLLGVPQKLIRDEDDVKKLRAQRAKAMQEAQAAAAKQQQDQQLAALAAKGNSGGNGGAAPARPAAAAKGPKSRSFEIRDRSGNLVRTGMMKEE